MIRGKTIDIFVGVRAEQSLRDAVRAQQEAADTDSLELVPVGKKDWIAGRRVGSQLELSEVDAVCRDVLRALLQLGTPQRIRLENVALYPVQPPVPVFQDAEPELPEPAPPEPAEKPQPKGDTGDTAQTCPVCGRIVHPYNLHYNSEGAVVGCFMCGGVSGM